MVAGEHAVLVVEDEDATRALFVELLQLEGFKVVGCPDGAQALDYLAHAEAPCLIVLDLRMPVMDGSQFRSALLRDPRLASVPVVIVTAFEPAAAVSLSALRVFRKPVDVSAFVGVVRENC
jgi:CheY-like chemotaxis protein